MAPGPKQPRYAQWRRDLARSDGSGGGGPGGPAGLQAVLSTGAERTQQVWAYLRDVDDTSPTNLRTLEGYLEAVYQVLVADAASAHTVAEAVAGALSRIDDTKRALRVLRRTVQVATERGSPPPDSPLARVASDEEELVKRKDAVIAELVRLREALGAAARVVSLDASVASRRHGRPAKEPEDRPHHHRPFRATG
jgi:hypothetical protein